MFSAEFAGGYPYCRTRWDETSSDGGVPPGSLEIESKLLDHPAVAEAAVLGQPLPGRGRMIKAFVSLQDGYTWSDNLMQELKDWVRHTLGVRAVPGEFEVRDYLPKTRSGKVLRQALQAWHPGPPAGGGAQMET